MEKPYFPLFVDISEKEILVVGGGKIATRRVKTLLHFSIHITVIAPKVSDELEFLAKEKQITWIPKLYEKTVLDGKELVLATTDQRMVNREILQDCRNAEKRENRTILVNVADDKSLCDFYFPSIIETDEVVIGINSGGKDPGIVRRMRKKIELLFMHMHEQ